MSQQTNMLSSRWFFIAMIISAIGVVGYACLLNQQFAEIQRQTSDTESVLSAEEEAKKKCSRNLALLDFESERKQGQDMALRRAKLLEDKKRYEEYLSSHGKSGQGKEAIIDEEKKLRSKLGELAEEFGKTVEERNELQGKRN